ncbi:Cupin domain-containing protein [Salinibacillus kushneri]|uniref:Cupin domain-containing protein n=1 Tax=Salinibacillus kushneri TaxID=237682 RepID=A0A1I0EV17_9BACI|nr:cupin domain-containing protein [Salinibacillus kushneri]SET49445.1 Cupin domain-containing protein [Salinibacillus kushneri]
MSISLSTENLKELCANRKKTFDEIVNNLDVQGNEVYVDSFDEVKKIAHSLNVQVSDLFNNSEESDLNEGVKIQYNNQGYKRTSKRDGKDYYTYQHLVTTNTEPYLMPLKVTLYCNDEDDIRLNEGHDTKEVIYVTKGKIRMDWSSKDKIYRQELNVGDSVYIKPGTPHSFMAIEEDSELLAFNY